MGLEPKLKKNSNNTGLQNINKQFSIGSIEIKIPIFDSILIIENVNVVSTNEPFLFGRDLIDKYNLHVNNVKNILSCPTLDIEVPLEQKPGHIYLS